MRLINYDFDDLYALIVFFRNDTDKIAEYAEAIKQIIACLEGKNGENESSCNTIRKILQYYVKEEEPGLFWIWVENVYTGNVLTMKNEGYYRVLAAVFREMLVSIGDNQRLWRLCDATHNLPILLVECKAPKKGIKSMIRIYQVQYNKDFLEEELKAL